MLISHHYEFIFVKTAKTAGSSVEAFLIPYLKENDEIIKKGGHEVSENELYYHAKADRVKQVVPDLWEKYFTFAIVRHPCERLISAYWHRIERNREGWKSFSDFLENAPKGHLLHSHVCIDDEVAVDRLLYFENLLWGLQTLCHELGVPVPLDLPKKKTKIRKDKSPWQTVWTQNDLDVFKKKYPKEYEFHKQLGYSFDL